MEIDKLSALNARLTKINIKGSVYTPVNQRILGFYELYPEGRIVTKLMGNTDKSCLFKAEIYADSTSIVPIANGHAREEKAGMVNSTSYIENCETSAVGRALGMLGIGATESIASADEVENAIKLQEAQKTSSKARSEQNPSNLTWNTPDASQTARESARAANANRFTKIGELKEKLIAAGVKEEGLKSWLDATFTKEDGSPLPMRDYSDTDIKAVEAYFTQLAADQKELHGKGGLNG